MVGKILGNFKITSLIGIGGMGEVYLAKDQKLGRDVAIKVLPEEFAEDRDRVARFQREAKLLASLNHPNIASIYGFEETEGTHFLVLELVEGDTLADQIKKGPIPLEESLKLALQITEGLEAAHEKGVIHRDLKPANIKVTPEGTVKILDFGLAKAFAGEREDVILSESPTLSMAATRQGVILGTAAYMSPEQARGKTVDKRTDIWAFGCVLYEMLTGRKTWSGDTLTDIIAAAVAKEPDFTILPDNLHPRIQKLLSRCLCKDAKERFRDIGDVRIEVTQILEDPRGELVQPVAAMEPVTKPRSVLPWIMASVVTTLIMAAIVIWIFWPAPTQPRVARFSVELAGKLNNTVALSPDGSRFVYPANGQLYIQALDQMEPTPISGTQQGGTPFFSPDGKSVAFFTPKQLKKVSLAGGAPVVLADVESGFVGTWDSQDRIFFGQFGSFGLSQVSAGGGIPEVFAKLEDHLGLDHPDVLPGGEWVLFTDCVRLIDNTKSGDWNNANIVVQSLATGERKILLEGGFFARYAPTGHLVFAKSSTLYAVAFDVTRLEVTGKPVPVVQNVRTVDFSGYGGFDIAANGTLIYNPKTEIYTPTPKRTLVWVDREGNEEAISAPPSYYRNPRISPDGTQLALSIQGRENRDIWIWDLVRETMMPLTTDEAPEGHPLWTPDGQRIAFNSVRDGVVGGYWRAADGTGEIELLCSCPDQSCLPWSWSGDGSTLILFRGYGGSSFDIATLSMEGNRELKPLLKAAYGELQPEISPDGHWLAYQSVESGGSEIYMRPFPDVEKKRSKVSTSGGDSPLWSPDGRKLYYRSGDAVMAVTIDYEPQLKLSKPRILFQGNYVGISLQDVHEWDIHPDGKRFLMIKPPEISDSESKAETPAKINVVLNWFEELKDRVPVE